MHGHFSIGGVSAPLKGLKSLPVKMQRPLRPPVTGQAESQMRALSCMHTEVTKCRAKSIQQVASFLIAGDIQLLCY